VPTLPASYTANAPPDSISAVLAESTNSRNQFTLPASTVITAQSSMFVPWAGLSIAHDALAVDVGPLAVREDQFWIVSEEFVVVRDLLKRPEHSLARRARRKRTDGEGL